MNAARYFRRYFSSNRLKNIYSDKIKYRATVGMDRITPAAFENKLDENVRLISQKVLSGKYKFTRYREVLISKGRGKEPRVITKNISRSSYIINADRYSFEEKAEILSEIYNQRNFNKNDARTVDSLFKATMFKEVQRLEYDIQNFS